MKRYWSLKLVINTIMLVVIFIIFTIQLVYFSYLSNLIEVQKEKDVNNMIFQVDNYIKNKIGILSQIQSSSIYTFNLNDYFSADSEIDRKQYKQNITQSVTNIQDFNADIIYTMGFDSEGKIHSFSNNINELEYNKIADIYSEYSGTSTFNESNSYHFFTNDNNLYKELYVCSFVPVTVRDYTNVGSTRVGTSVAYIKINILKMSKELEQIEGIELMLTNSIGHEHIPIFSSEAAWDDTSSITRNTKIDNTSWSIQGTLFSGEMVFLLKYIRWLIVLETVVILFLIILMQIIFAKYITNPIHKITKYMDEYALNTRNDPLIISGKSEISVIGEHFNNMLEKNKKMARDIVNTQQKLFDTELSEKEAVLYALQSQINPHFLYNTLECVRTIALVRNVPEIVEIMTSMAQIFRYTISNESETTVRDEVYIAEKYISIMQIRYDNNFETNIDIPEEILNKKVIKMVLQPIVENAFKHGLTANKNKGVLKIKGYIENDTLKFFIYDNGKGIEKEKYKTLLAKINTSKESWYNTKGVGLVNINNRIKLNYGEKYGLEINCAEGEFTEVIIKLPA